MKILNKEFLKNIFSLKDKVIVVTGASGLLGRMHVEAIASQGGIPVIIDIDEKGLNELYDFIVAEYSIEPHIELIDITIESQIAGSAERVANKYGKIDGLVNNAAKNPSDIGQWMQYALRPLT